jgi:hypothetical protein
MAGAYAGRAGAILGAISGPIWYMAMFGTGTVQTLAIITAIHEWAIGFALGGVSTAISLAEGKFYQATWRLATTIATSAFGLHGLAGIKHISPVRYAKGLPHEGLAFQSDDTVAIAARTFVEEGVPIYRLGKIDVSDAAEGQFWSLNNPLTTPNYANNMGIPPQNATSANFVIIGHLRSGTDFVTRPAPGIGQNQGGTVEVVVPRDSVQIDGFLTYPTGVPLN